MKRFLVVGRAAGSPPCAHVHQSGQLRFDPSGVLTAWLVCDDCDQTIGVLPRQSAEVRLRLLVRAQARAGAQSA